MVDPHMAPAEDGDAITVGFGPPPVVACGVPYHGVPPLLAVVYVHAVDDDIGYILDSDAGAIGDVHARSPAVDGLERVHYQLLLQLDHHVAREYDPQRLLLDDRVPERPWLRVNRVIIARIRHHVDLPIPTTNGILAKPNCTIG